MNKLQHDKETWFYRGRFDRGQNKPREFPNGRVSMQNRQHWYDGWDEEDRIRAPKPTVEQVTQFNSFLTELAAEARRNHASNPSF